jgi:IclR family acetate operon transcriptional repressor
MVETRRYPDVKARVGHHDALHATALGKSILAFLPDDDQEACLGTELSERTIKTITDRTRLKQELGAVRERGYALDREENEDGAMCVGVPILCGPAYPVAAISITMLTRSRSTVPLDEVTRELKKAAANVSIKLDHSMLVANFKDRHRMIHAQLAAPCSRQGEHLKR